MILRTLFLASALTLSGCATIMEATNEGPIEQNHAERSFGNYLNDSKIEDVTKVNMNKTSPELKASNVEVHAFNGIVLLIGQVHDESLRRLASDIAKGVKGVRQVNNEIQITGRTSLLSKSNDLYLKSKVKTRIFANETKPDADIKVIVENSVVYLMGRVQSDDADIVTQIASTTGGVQRVVRVFEYL